MIHLRLLRLLVPLAVCFVLAGCGQKGPLFLPDQTPQSGELTEVVGE